jgi:hypothetical protein
MFRRGRVHLGLIEAADGVSGLKVLQSDVRIDLLITDVGLPDASRRRLMAELLVRSSLALFS